MCWQGGGGGGGGGSRKSHSGGVLRISGDSSCDGGGACRNIGSAVVVSEAVAISTKENWCTSRDWLKYVLYQGALYNQYETTMEYRSTSSLLMGFCYSRVCYSGASLYSAIENLSLPFA